MKLVVEKNLGKNILCLFGTPPGLPTFRWKEQKVGIQDNGKRGGRARQWGFSTGAGAMRTFEHNKKGKSGIFTFIS